VNGIAFCLLALSGLAFAQKPDRFFDAKVVPILTQRCLGCHNHELNDGGISFEDRDSLLKGGSRGPAIVPGKPEASVVIYAVRQDGNLKMPPAKLSRKQIAILTEWIHRGAPWGTSPRPKP